MPTLEDPDLTPLEQLASRDRQVLLMRTGFGGVGRRNLEQIAIKLGVTRERVRQLQVRGLLKLRELPDAHNTYVRCLEAIYLNLGAGPRWEPLNPTSRV